MSVVYIIVLLLIGFFLIFVEIFVPGGIIGILGMTIMGFGIWMCFDQYGREEGLAVLLLCIMVTLTIVIVGFKCLPRSYFGKWIILGNNVSKEEGYHSDTYVSSNLVNKEGVSESELRPAGIALIEGERLDVVTEGEFIEPHSRIRVIRVDGNRIVVERA